MRLCFLGTGERLAYLRRYASPGVELEAMTDFVGRHPRPSSIESRVEELDLAQSVVEHAVEAERRGYDAMITGCFGDPGVDAAREMVRIPVIAPGETALLTARMLAHSFSILTPLPQTVPLAREQVQKLGLHPFVASIRVLGLPVERIREREPAAIDRLVALCRRCVEEDGAEALVFGCASMSVLADEIAPRVVAPLVNSVKLSLKAAEMLVGAGLSHSRVAFPTPPKLAALTAAE